MPRHQIIESESESEGEEVRLEGRIKSLKAEWEGAKKKYKEYRGTDEKERAGLKAVRDAKRNLHNNAVSELEAKFPSKGDDTPAGPGEVTVRKERAPRATLKAQLIAARKAKGPCDRCVSSKGLKACTWDGEHFSCDGCTAFRKSCKWGGKAVVLKHTRVTRKPKSDAVVDSTKDRSTHSTRLKEAPAIKPIDFIGKLHIPGQGKYFRRLRLRDRRAYLKHARLTLAMDESLLRNRIKSIDSELMSVKRDIEEAKKNGELSESESEEAGEDGEEEEEFAQGSSKGRRKVKH